MSINVDKMFKACSSFVVNGKSLKLTLYFLNWVF